VVALPSPCVVVYKFRPPPSNPTLSQSRFSPVHPGRCS